MTNDTLKQLLSVFDIVKPGRAVILSVNDMRLIADHHTRLTSRIDDTEALEKVRYIYRGLMIADCSLPGYSADYFGAGVRVDESFFNTRFPGIRTVDHHAPYDRAPDGSSDPRNSTMKLLDIMEAALAKHGGDADAAIRELHIIGVTTNNLADGSWCVWIAKNQKKVLEDMALRSLIRAATFFEDFSAFGTTYLDDLNAPHIVLQAALFRRYDEILKAHGIRGSDRFLFSMARGVLTHVVQAIDEILGSQELRVAAARDFFNEVDQLKGVVTEKAVMPDLTVKGQVIFFDKSQLGRVPTFVGWLALPRAHDFCLQVEVGDIPTERFQKASAPDRKLYLVAIPYGRKLPSGKGLVSLLDVINKAEKLKGTALKTETAHWTGRDNVIFPAPARRGSLILPGELSMLLTDEANGLFLKN